MGKSSKKYSPYNGLEFHLSESIRLHGDEEGLSDAHYEASAMVAEIEQGNVDMIPKYREYCKVNGIKSKY